MKLESILGIHGIHGSVLQSLCKHWIHKYSMIVPRTNKGLGPCKPLVIISSTDQHITYFFFCCSETPYLIYVFES